jgi:putative membrane protein
MKSYNGQQGDIWDPQKDLAMAFIGSVISAALVFRRNYR